MEAINKILNTPWKAINEIVMHLLVPPSFIYTKFVGVNTGVGCKFYGLPRFFRFRGSKIIIGDRFENRNFWDSNPLGVDHPTIICTWGKDSIIKIGNDVGMSGGSIVAAESVEIGDGTLIGANSTIIDTDFHPINSLNRRYTTQGVGSKSIKIGKNVFIGMNCIILKGVNIPDNSIVPAGSVVRKWPL